jgi:hypothetical protein
MLYVGDTIESRTGRSLESEVKYIMIRTFLICEPSEQSFTIQHTALLGKKKGYQKSTEDNLT